MQNFRPTRKSRDVQKKSSWAQRCFCVVWDVSYHEQVVSITVSSVSGYTEEHALCLNQSNLKNDIARLLPTTFSVYSPQCFLLQYCQSCAALPTRKSF